MKSKLYTYENNVFRYDYDNATVEWYGSKDIFVEDGDVIDSVGLSKENWNDKEARDSYLEGWLDDLHEEMNCLVADFMRYELPYLKAKR